MYMNANGSVVTGKKKEIEFKGKNGGTKPDTVGVVKRKLTN